MAEDDAAGGEPAKVEVDPPGKRTAEQSPEQRRRWGKSTRDPDELIRALREAGYRNIVLPDAALASLAED